MRKARKLESTEERAHRLRLEAQTRRDESAAADRAVEAMVRRSIELYGP